jgi:hypothetical protein
MSKKDQHQPLEGELVTAGESPAPRKKPGPPKGTGGRPSTYTQEIAAEILQRLAQGESLNSITRDPVMPVLSTVYLWLLRHPDFSENYVRAREEQAETYADEIVALADEEPVQVVDDKGVGRVDSAWVTWQKNRVDARKWVASKLKPKRYGERVQHEGGDTPIQVESKPGEELAAVLKNLELRIRGGSDEGES